MFWIKDELEDEMGKCLNGSGEWWLMIGDIFEKVGVNFSDVYGIFLY